MKKSVAFMVMIVILILVFSSVSNNVNKKVSLERNENLFGDLYVKNNIYSVAPSELSNKDLERPKDNTDWTRSLRIYYPQLYNMEDDKRQNKINDLIYKKVMAYNSVLLEDRDYTDYIINYKIMSSNSELFSVLFLGEVSDYKTSTRVAFGISINIKDGEEISLDKLFEVDDSFVENYLFSKFSIVNNNFNDVKENIPYIEKFVKNYSVGIHNNDFYVKNGGVGIIIPTDDSMGYILIEERFEQ